MLKSRRLQKTVTNLQINGSRFWRCRIETNCKSSSCFRLTQRNGSKRPIWMIGCWSFSIFPVWTSMWSFEQSCFKTNTTLTFRHHLEALFLLSSLSMARRLRQTKMPSNERGWGIPAAPYPDIVRWKLSFGSICFGKRQSPSRMSCKIQRRLASMFSSDNRSASPYSACSSEHVFFSSPSRTRMEPSFWCVQAEALSSVRKANSELRSIDFKTASHLFPR